MIMYYHAVSGERLPQGQIDHVAGVLLHLFEFGCVGDHRVPPISFSLILYNTFNTMPPRGNEGLDFTPILTQYLFLFTSVFAVVSNTQYR
jgi:hypothetical protein